MVHDYELASNTLIRRRDSITDSDADLSQRGARPKLGSFATPIATPSVLDLKNSSDSAAIIVKTYRLHSGYHLHSPAMRVYTRYFPNLAAAGCARWRPFFEAHCKNLQ